MSVQETLTAGQPLSVSEEAATERLLDLVDDRTRDLIQKRRGSDRRRGWLVRRALAAADATGILLAFALTQVLFPPDVEPQYDRVRHASRGHALRADASVLDCSRTYLQPLLERRRANRSLRASTTSSASSTWSRSASWLFFALAYVFDFANPSFPKLALFWVLAIVLVPVCRTIARALCRRSDAYVLNTLIVGAGHVGQRVAKKLLQHPEYRVNVVGFVDEHPRDRIDGLENLSVVGRPAELPEIVSGLDVDRVIVAFSQQPHGETLENIRDLNQRGVQVDVVPRFFEALGPHATMHAAEGLTLIGLPPARWSRSSLLLKRVMDILISFVGVLVLAPVFLFIAVAIKLDSRGPVFFRQVRMGRGTRGSTSSSSARWSRMQTRTKVTSCT